MTRTDIIMAVLWMACGAALALMIFGLFLNVLTYNASTDTAPAVADACICPEEE